MCDLQKGSFAAFKQTIDHLGYVNIATRELDQLKLEIEDSLNKSPYEKQKEIDRITSEINDLEKEKNLVVSHIATIDELEKNV